SERRCAAAAVYTANRFQAPPLRLTQQHLADGYAQGVIVNTGCANSLTGEQGARDAQEMAELASAKLAVAENDIVVASTGVTGWLLPMERIRAGIGHVISTEDGGEAFAHAIMTTDTVAKQAAVQFEWDGVTYSVGGAAKGSGMVHVDMATMLAFLTTDAPVDPAVLASLLKETCDASFNMLTIDGATSTNDMALVLANGSAGGERFDAGHPGLPLLRAALVRVAVTLTRKLARDGEGASKLLEVRVDGAASIEDARRAAKAVAGSMLLKAAVFGNDPNWGRVLDAVGYSGADAREERLSLSMQGVEVYRDGAPLPFDLGALARALAHAEVDIRVDLGAGDASATAWGCDLSYEYVRINGSYRT
ncbi:MAG: bifunctional glutamate N-acetyltransferase/amino-acid acetyltransferase ArgJ, partial [Dehalococcoidia bacterium]|nr:bifunctional glutamate N-acetyltransferase/amino-acid acetyltransferase ArgJ [Dehalococcoidia bacterium]